MGRCDEITAGRSLQGKGGLPIYVDSLPGEASTPQVLVGTRMIDASSEEYPHQSHRVSKATALTRQSGVTAISAWLDRGSPLSIDLVELE